MGMCKCQYVCKYACVRTWVCVRMRACVCACVCARAHTHTHTHTHTQITKRLMKQFLASILKEARHTFFLVRTK